MNKVTNTIVKDYNLTDVVNAIKTHFNLLGINDKLTPQTKVLLKPNLLMKRKPHEATTTHPVIMEGIIICLQELGVNHITIADSPGGPYVKQAIASIYTASGMEQVAKKYNVTLNQDFESKKRHDDNCVMVKEFTLINPVHEADFIINVAKLKTHTMTTLSGAVKNLFGTVPGLMKPEFHFRFPDKSDFSNMLLDLCQTVKPNLCIVDAVVSMEGDGPSGGTLRNTGLILGSTNPYDLDFVLCHLIGLNYQDVLTVKYAIKRGLSVSNLDKIELLGDTLIPIKDYKMPASADIDFVGNIPPVFRKIFKPFSKRFLTSKPIIVKSKCIGCGKCAESCPAKTIAIRSKKAIIDYSKCIKCYCCHEMCPPKAIDIKRSKLFNL